MSRDIFTNPAVNRSSSVHIGFDAGSISKARNRTSSILGSADPEMQRLVDAINAKKEAERVRKEVEMDTPENRLKAAEAEAAEKERKKLHFHVIRAKPRFLEDGWKHIRGELVEEEIRVFTVNHDRRRFWGIKPAGMGMDDFWEQNDPEVGRYDDKYAETWVNALVPPPVTAYDENMPVIWAGRGLNPDLIPTEPPIAKSTPPTKAVTKSRTTRKQPNLNPNHRVTKSTNELPEVNKKTRKTLASKIDAGNSRHADQTREVRAEAYVDETSKRVGGRPATKAKSAVQDDIPSTPRRPRGRPSAKTNPVKNEKDATRPRGRPPAKEKPIENPPKQKKTPAVKGNARITKSSQTKTRTPAPSTHKMRTRAEGSARLLQL